MQYRAHTRVFLIIALIQLSLLILIILTTSDQISLILSSTVIALLAILYPVLHYRIGRPLALIKQALDTENPSLVEKLISSKTEFGQIATLVKKSHLQRTALVSEINERKKIEMNLRTSELRYKNLVETSPDIILVMDISGNILINNIGAAVLFDISKTLPPKKLITCIHQSDQQRISTILQNMLQTERISNIECIMLNKDGKLFSAEMNLSLLKDDTVDKDHNIMAIIKDISDRKSAEIEKEKREEQFRVFYKMEAIGQLAGGIAHDFNNILGAISGYAEIINHMYDKDEKLTKYSKMIISAASRAAELNSKLLTFARKGKLKILPFDIHYVLRDLNTTLKHTIDKNIVIATDLDAEESVVNGDISQFQSAIMNLILNAKDAMPNGGTITIRSGNKVIDSNHVKGHAYSLSPGNYVFISVSDTGTGIDKQTKSHLFEPFFTTKDIGKGAGLGLASVYGTVKSHRGYINVESEPGEGSTFSMYFPVNQQLPPGKTTTQTGAIIKGNGHILVVDDESFIRDATKEMLVWLGYRVSTVTTGEEAIEFIKTQSIDLIILDWMMPEMNGIECFKKIRSIDGSIKAVLSTGKQIDDPQSTVYNEGFVGIIQKPFVSAQLAQIIYDALR